MAGSLGVDPPSPVVSLSFKNILFAAATLFKRGFRAHPPLSPPPATLILCPHRRVDLRQRQDGSRYAFVEFGDCAHVQEIMASGPFTLDEQTVRLDGSTHQSASFVFQRGTTSHLYILQPRAIKIIRGSVDGGSPYPLPTLASCGRWPSLSPSFLSYCPAFCSLFVSTCFVRPTLRR